MNWSRARTPGVVLALLPIAVACSTAASGSYEVSTKPFVTHLGSRWDVRFKITFTASGSAHINPVQFYVREPDGTHISWGSGDVSILGGSDELAGTQLADGEKVTGFLDFDAPTVHGTLIYGPNGKELTKF